MDPKTVFFTGVFLMFLMAATRTEGKTTVRRLYQLFLTPKTWSEAQSFCRVNYTDLATVDNMEEQMQLMQSIGNAAVSNIWIGLKKSATTQWGWSEGTGLVFDWDASQGAGNCVWMAPEGNWNADQCSNLKAFLCFKYDSNRRESCTLYTTPMSWRSAQSFCRQHHTDLVSVKTTAQNKEIQMHANSSSVWIGLFRSNWMWSDRSTSAYRYWDAFNPDNYGGVQNCVRMRRSFSYQWDDGACDLSFPFACYRELKARIVVKVKMSSAVDLATQSDSLLKQFQARLEEQGVPEVKISWRAGKNKQIFHCGQDENNGT